MLLVALYFVISTLAVDCQPDGDHATTCQVGKCELVDDTEICTECKAGGVPIDGFCRPVGSPQVITAGCTGPEDAPLDKATTTCGRCSGADHFLFMGGCYNQKVGVGSVICTAAAGGECTACATANWLFENPSGTPGPGTKCILCSDIKGDGTTKGVENCAECTKPAGSPGVAICSKCEVGYYKDGTCKKCDATCLTCSGSGNTACETCPEGKYLKVNQFVQSTGCDGNTYPDPETRTCKASGIADCTTCEYNPVTKGPRCIACSGKIVKEEADGTTKCIDAGTCTQNGATGENFLSDGDTECILCSNDSSKTDNNKGSVGCRTCNKNGAKPECKTCLDGYYDSGNGNPAVCVACAGDCGKCGPGGAIDTCEKCKSGFFLKSEGTKKCVRCDDPADGITGCATCTFSGLLTCDTCKPNYTSKTTSRGVACEKACEDETACGGTAGACDAGIVDPSGKTLNYCSLCGDPATFPIDGKCVESSKKGANTCDQGACTQCTQGYFLYMGGCYRYDAAPGSHACSASAAPGVCSAPSPNNQFFVVPGAANNQQSVLACGNPLGTAVGDRTYVGVEGCSQCTAPAQLEASGMASATCTACGEGRKPNKSGTGCVACSVENCRHCRVDGVCEECSSGFSLEGGKCISTGTSGGNRSGLSTGAIAGIAVAVVVVVGGLVGFLCWWFICRGKA
ncbi:VSP [Giardia lamblia P15]|uniref:VSP n=1 Tax=Giardia intestinalis (strain P15) TaxID=658858 RepID=E1F8S0_GIAIA|nr:VSP [Giardia lamblia P15]